MLDCRAVTFSMNKIIKTGLLSLPSTTNVEIPEKIYFFVERTF